MCSAPPPPDALPIDPLRERFEAAMARGPVVVTAPPGTGKSTQVPRWSAPGGKVLVVEPRRVACRALAQRVATLEGTQLGDGVGYAVRDERRASDTTGIVFCTPGVVLRMLAAKELGQFHTVILDELHERSLDTDLLLALLMRHHRGPLVAMSATVDGERVATHLGGEHLHAQGERFAVRVEYVAGKALLPELRGLEERLLRAVAAVGSARGDILVFLPGKAEIASCARALASHDDFDVLALHGGLSLAEQSRAFLPSRRTKILLATNVAETSVTVPGVGAVIDSGLVRQTRYYSGRGHLSLCAIADDSAVQRAGRAGRTQPGICMRLWSASATLAARTMPEIHRESLVPMVMSAAACGEDLRTLPLLDAPRPHAITAAVDDLQALGALAAPNALSERGLKMFGLPVDPLLARILVQAAADARPETEGKAETEGEVETEGKADTEGKAEAVVGAGAVAVAGAGAGETLLADVVDLVAGLSTDRPLVVSRSSARKSESIPRAPTRSRRAFVGGRSAAAGVADSIDEALDALDCDATAIILALRAGGEGAKPPWLDGLAFADAWRNRKRLRDAFSVRAEGSPNPERRTLAMTLLRADPRIAHVVRRRRGKIAWSNGGTEIELGRNSRVDAERSDAIAVLGTHAALEGPTQKRVWCTCAMPLEAIWLARAGLGRDRARDPRWEKGRVLARVERVYAGRVLAARDEEPSGECLRDAVATLVAGGSLFKGAAEMGPQRLRDARLYERLAASGLITPSPHEPPSPRFQTDDYREWLVQQLDALGLESPQDVLLLTPQDVLPDPLPDSAASDLRQEYPSTLSLGDCRFRLEYELQQRAVVLHPVNARRNPRPPPSSHLPRLSGLRILLQEKGGRRVLRERR